MRPKRSLKGTYPAVCVRCGELIDLVALRLAMAQSVEYVHPCGRKLWSAAYGDH